MKLRNMKSPIAHASPRVLALLAFVVLFAAGGYAQRKTAAPLIEKSDVIVTEPGNRQRFHGQDISCANLNASTDARYFQIVDDSQLNLNFINPNGRFDYRTYNSPQGPVVLTGSQPSPIKAVHVASSGTTVTSFASQVQVLAAILYNGKDSYVYSYAYADSPITYGATDLRGGDGTCLTHVKFCYGVAVAPSAAPASIAGRVVSSNGMGISSTRITVTSASTGLTYGALSNAFGYYTVVDIPLGEYYFISASNKRYTFANDQIGFTLNDNLTGVDFVANPQ